MEDQKIVFTIEGKALTENYPLYEVINILSDFYSLVDQSYLVLSGAKKLTKTERLNYHILSSFPRKGSYEVDLAILYLTAQQVLPCIPLSAADIWNCLKDSYGLLKYMFSLQKEGKEAKVNIDKNSGLVIIQAPNSGPIQVTQNVYNTATRSEPSYKKMVSYIDEENIKTISATDTSKTGIVLTTNERELFNPETKIQETPILLNGEIIDLNKDRVGGKFRVVPDQQIAPGDYPFEIVGKQNFPNYIEAMKKTKIAILCLPEIRTSTTGAEKIVCLRVVNLKQSNGSHGNLIKEDGSPFWPTLG